MNANRLISIFFILLASISAGAQHHNETATQSSGNVDLGEITFPTSGSPEAQKAFIKGTLLLHSFEYDRARTAYQEARRLDPSFAMAYWGEAMAWNYSIWGEQNRKAALNVLSLLGATPAERKSKAPTDREKLYLGAVESLYGEGDKIARDAAYSNAMAEIVRRYPDDMEARAFYSLSILGLSDDVRNTENYMRAAAVAEEVYQRNPRHPGALHYLIHAYDDPVHAPLGLRAARLYGTVAKSASHAQHMPSHIFFALGMWDEANAANEAATKTARDAGGGGYHPLQWLEHGYLQLGRDADAAKLVALVESDMQKQTTPAAAVRSTLAMCRATWLVEASNPDTMLSLEPVDTTGITAIGEFAGLDLAIGLTHLRQKDVPAAKRDLDRLRQRIATGKAMMNTKADIASRYNVVTGSQIASTAVMERELDAAITFAAGDKKLGLEKILAAGEAEDKLPFEFGPPTIVKPVWEAAGEMFLEAGQKKEAVAAFQKALKKYPNRRLSNEGLRKAGN
ncbi:MAG: tetratricopeptide repeat protein [Acidobacteriota bacterium]